MFVLRFRSNADSLDCSAERNRQMPRQQAHPGSLGLLGTISPRTLVGLGFSTGAYALYHMTGWTPDISEWTVISVGFIQGISLGFITIPINIITFATLPAELRTEGAGVYSLVRNLGSAIGISVTGALLSINTQANHALIAGEVTPFDRAFQHGAAAQVWQLGTVHGSLLLNEEVTRQARIIAYIDDFKLMLVLAIGALPLLLLTRPPPKRKAAVQRS
jgi:DHA2 family multidrug resistance protein